MVVSSVLQNDIAREADPPAAPAASRRDLPTAKVVIGGRGRRRRATSGGGRFAAGGRGHLAVLGIATIARLLISIKSERGPPDYCFPAASRRWLETYLLPTVPSTIRVAVTRSLAAALLSRRRRRVATIVIVPTARSAILSRLTRARKRDLVDAHTSHAHALGVHTHRSSNASLGLRFDLHRPFARTSGTLVLVIAGVRVEARSVPVVLVARSGLPVCHSQLSYKIRFFHHPAFERGKG